MEEQHSQQEHTYNEIAEQVLEVAPELERDSSLHIDGMDAFTIDALAHRLNMDDAEDKRELTLVVGQLVSKGRLIGHSKTGDTLSAGSG